MATYNWAYQPGVVNKYGLSVPASADNVKPSNWSYVALFGNDLTGNGSRQYPWRTISQALGIGDGNVVISSGVYRENINSNGQQLIGDGDVIIDGLFFSITINGSPSANLRNIKVRNWQYPTNASSVAGSYDTSIDGSGTLYLYMNFNSQNTLFSNIATLDIQNTTNQNSTNGYNTFVNIGNLLLDGGSLNDNNQGSLWSSIYENCNISIDANPVFDYCLFHNCSFRMGNSGSFTPISDLPTLQALIQTVYPLNISLSHCVFTDPLFNNPTIGDYSLAFNSPAKNGSYFGTFIGAKSIAYSIQALSASTLSGFDFSSINNLVINNNSITIVNTNQTASVETTVVPNLIQREIRSIPTYGFNADKNGEYIDSILDLSATGLTASQSLTAPTPYLVGTGAIVYNGQTYQPGNRLTTLTGITAFTTTASGVLYEILEAPERHTVMARFSNGFGNVTSGTSLTNGYWYYVDSGTVIYSGNTYSGGTPFKAQDTSSFSGSGTVELVMTGQTYQHYEINSKPYSNNVGNSRIGDIIRGNGDPNYVRGGINITEFPINAKFIQFKYIFQVANLTP